MPPVGLSTVSPSLYVLAPELGSAEDCPDDAAADAESPVSVVEVSVGPVVQADRPRMRAHVAGVRILCMIEYYGRGRRCDRRLLV